MAAVDGASRARPAGGPGAGVVASNATSAAAVDERPELRAPLAPIAPAAASLGSVHDARVERAKGVIEVLRDGGAKRTAYQGRVEIGEIDAPRVLRSYYPSLELAHGLVEAAPDAAGFVARFSESSISVPGDLRPIAMDASGATLGIPPEPEGPVGTVQLYPGGQILEALRSGDAARMRFDDGTVDRMFKGTVNEDLSEAMKVLSPPSEEIAAVLIRLYARAAQRNAEVRVSHWEEIAERLPRSPESTALLKRLARRLHADETAIRVWGRALTEASPGESARVLVSGPAGGVDRFHRDPSGEAWSKAVKAGEPDAFRIDDLTVLRATGLWSHSADRDLQFLFGLYEPNTAKAKLGLLALCARSRELGVSTMLEAADLQKHADELPASPEAIDVLRLVVRAFAIEESRIRLRGKPLSEYPPSIGVPPPSIDRSLPLDRHRAYAAVLRNPDRLNDEWLRTRFHDGFLDFIHRKNDDEQKIGVLMLIDRAVEIGALNRGLVEIPFGRSFDQILGGDLARDPQAMDLIARICRRTPIDPMISTVDGTTPLAQHRPYLEAVGRLDRRMLREAAPVERRNPLLFFMPRGPLGEMGQKHLKQLWADRDASLFECDDATLDLCSSKHAHSGGRPRPVLEWLEHWDDARVFKFFARLGERHYERDRFESTKAVRTYFAENVIPARFVTSESLPWIVRMAETAYARPETVWVEGPNGPCSLFDHPAYEKPACEARRRAIDLVHELTASNAGREKAILALLAGADPALEVADFLAPLVSAAGEGGVARVKLSDRPENERMEFLRAAFAPWSHVGVVAAVAGAVAEVPAADVARLLAEKGADPETAKKWGAIASRIGELDPGGLRFVLEDLVRQPDRPDFRTLPFRLDLLERFDPKRLKKSLAANGVHSPVEHVRALIDRVLLEPLGGALRQELLALVERAIAEGSVPARALPLAIGTDPAIDLERPGGWPLYRELVLPVEEALARYAAGSGVERRDAIAVLLDRAVRLARYVGGASVAELILPRAYAADEIAVLPLGVADSLEMDPIDVALGHIRRFADQRPPVATVEQKRAFEWVELAIRRAIPDRIDAKALVGLGEAYHAGLVTKATLELAREKLPADLVGSAIDRVRSSDARALLRNRPIKTRFTLRRTGGALRIPEVRERVGAAVISRGSRPPSES
jgi:hypothetical protein